MKTTKSQQGFTHVSHTTHDYSAVTPYHVTVIRSISDLIGVDPTKTPLSLGDFVPIHALDAICDVHEPNSDVSLTFYYRREGEADLKVNCSCDGAIDIWECY